MSLFRICTEIQKRNKFESMTHRFYEDYISRAHLISVKYKVDKNFHATNQIEGAIKPYFR